jgi:hypothetical protein
MRSATAREPGPIIEPRLADSPATAHRAWAMAFRVCWVAVVLGLGWQISRSQHEHEPAPAVVALTLAGLAVCTISLAGRLHCPMPASVPSLPSTRRLRLAGATLISAVVLVAPVVKVGPALLFGVPVVAGVVAVRYRRALGRRDVMYAVLLAAIAAVAGLRAGWIEDVRLPVWAALQVPLVVTGLLAGWAVLRATGLERAGFGRWEHAPRRVASLLRAVLVGMLIGVPWALANVVLGDVEQDGWVRSWWEPAAALQPGIAEEAWGRVLLIPLLYLGLWRVARAPTALTTAVVVASLWFAYLHTYDQEGVVVSTLLLGALYALPLAYLWLARGLETAIGAHVCIDAVRFTAAYLFNAGLWFGD